MTTTTGRRELLAGGLAMFGSAALPAIARAEEPGAQLRLIHPELREIFQRMQPMLANRPTFSRANLASIRVSASRYSKPPLADVPWEKRTVPGKAGQPDVGVVLVNPKAGDRRPAILHTHGGGYFIGSAESSVNELQGICKALDCMAVSVDYRLAPETTYAGSIEDNYAALKWLHANAEALGVDATRIAVMGESAGGGHAAMLAIAARDRGEVPVCFQCLIYPMLDDRTGATVQPPAHVGTIAWNRESNRFGWECFLGQKPGLRRAPVQAVPARLANLAGLPPAFIGVGTLDLFCDEDIDYAQRLNAAGVPAELIVVQGAFHGFDDIAKLANVPLGRWFEATKLNALKRGFGMAVS